jgi:hypothetical protein
MNLSNFYAFEKTFFDCDEPNLLPLTEPGLPPIYDPPAMLAAFYDPFSCDPLRELATITDYASNFPCEALAKLFYDLLNTDPCYDPF